MPQPVPGSNGENANTVMIKAGVTFANATSSFIWDENSPIPPGLRYFEMADYYALLAAGWGSLVLDSTTLINFDESILPKDSQGRIRRNLKPCGVDVSSFNGQPLSLLPSAPDIAAELAGIYADDSMWTGEVVDPVNWQDDWWDALLINRVAMQTYLEAHPGCRLNA